MLKLCKIAETKREGKEIVYSINAGSWPTQVNSGKSIFTVLDQHIVDHCGSCAKRKVPV